MISPIGGCFGLSGDTTASRPCAPHLALFPVLRPPSTDRPWCVEPRAPAPRGRKGLNKSCKKLYIPTLPTLLVLSFGSSADSGDRGACEIAFLRTDLSELPSSGRWPGLAPSTDAPYDAPPRRHLVTALDLPSSPRISPHLPSLGWGGLQRRLLHHAAAAPRISLDLPG